MTPVEWLDPAALCERYPESEDEAPEPPSQMELYGCELSSEPREWYDRANCDVSFWRWALRYYAPGRVDPVHAASMRENPFLRRLRRNERGPRVEWTLPANPLDVGSRVRRIWAGYNVEKDLDLGTSLALT